MMWHELKANENATDGLCSSKKLTLWNEIKADAIAAGGIFSYKRLARLLLLHSGFQLLVIFRIQQRIRRFKPLGGFLADLLLKFATDLTGCHIYPTTTLEKGIHFPHATGIVIGAGVIVRSGVTIYQNVTLGRRNIDAFEYPELCEGCTVCSGAAVLGNITIGKNAVVGANAVVLESVPDSSMAVGIPAKIIKQQILSTPVAPLFKEQRKFG